ncbi:universal stress protein [Streptomyces sp. NPDC017202]|uniref:universal stress protein n=1 Tax=Streptomyces sp. NPDC017202 TaxID=3364981 RepID=UPI00379B5E2B
MVRTVVAGIDGSSESNAAAEWAAREARLRGLPLTLVHVWQPVPEPMAQAPLLGTETQAHWSERVPRETAEGLRLRHPGVEITQRQLTGTPADVLADTAKDAELLVLGSRALGGLGGFLVGSVGLAAVAHTDVPVVLVRAGGQAADEHVADQAGAPSAAAPYRPVVLGLDVAKPDDAVLGFAFEEADRRGTALHVVHAWTLAPYYVYSLPAAPEIGAELGRQEAAALAEVLAPWRTKYPDVEVVEISRLGSAADRVLDAAREASLVVVGRRIRRSPLGTHIGPVAHAVLHHSTAPVAVVAHP